VSYSQGHVCQLHDQNIEIFIVFKTEQTMGLQRGANDEDQKKSNAATLRNLGAIGKCMNYNVTIPTKQDPANRFNRH
jgi:hypothetical protein